jgi:hypothetical protein
MIMDVVLVARNFTENRVASIDIGGSLKESRILRA